jgi:hypothetical protein
MLMVSLDTVGAEHFGKPCRHVLGLDPGFSHDPVTDKAIILPMPNAARVIVAAAGRIDKRKIGMATRRHPRAINSEPRIFRLLAALLVRGWEIRTPAKLGVPDIFERRAGLIDKGVDNHDPVVPKSKIQNPGLGVATLRIADELQFVGAKRTTFGLHCLYGTPPRRKLQARQQFFGQGGAGNLNPRRIIPAGGIVCRF